MLKFFRKFLGLCDHKWVVEETVKVWNQYVKGYPVAIQKHLRCEKCGNWKKVTFRG